MNNRTTGRAPSPTLTMRNLHFGRFVAVGASGQQPGTPLESAQWVIAAELPASLKTALDVEPRPVVSLGRLCVGHEACAALVTVSTEYAEVHFILPLGDSRTHAWRRESARVDLLTFVLVVDGEGLPFGVRVCDFGSLQEFWLGASEAEATQMTGGALSDECAKVTGLLMAQHMDMQKELAEAPRDRHYVLVSNEAFSAPMGHALDALANAFLASEPTAT